MLNPFTSARLCALPGIVHGFFTRQGGVSQGIYASLNCGSGSRDDPAAVAENRARVAAHLKARDLVSVYQVHSKTALRVDAPWPDRQRPKADAMVTAVPGLALGVLAADCAPVLFADAEAGVVAAAHAGWRGALDGVLEATLDAMEALGARRERICGAVGPCIGQSAYEVGWEFQDTFLAQDPGSRAYFVAAEAGARPHFDLAGYATDRLRRAGVTVEERRMPCTFTQNADLFSYRRSRRDGEADYGRQISAIVLT
jgi:YfiH family protein